MRKTRRKTIRYNRRSRGGDGDEDGAVKFHTPIDSRQEEQAQEATVEAVAEAEEDEATKLQRGAKRKIEVINSSLASKKEELKKALSNSSETGIEKQKNIKILISNLILRKAQQESIQQFGSINNNFIKERVKILEDLQKRQHAMNVYHQELKERPQRQREAEQQRNQFTKFTQLGKQGSSSSSGSSGSSSINTRGIAHGIGHFLGSIFV